jgi:hypothetical protein
MYKEILEEVDTKTQDLDVGRLIQFYENGITLRKNFFRQIPEEKCRRLIRQFPVMLDALRTQVTLGNHQKNIRKLEGIPAGQPAVWKYRMTDSDRVAWFWEDDVIYFVEYITNHDRQGTIVERLLQGMTGSGTVHFEIKEFLLRLQFVEAQSAVIHSTRQIEQYLCLDQYYRLSSEQSQVVGRDGMHETRNVSIIGNAGSGKTLVGSRWIHRHLRKGNCLYLTMSEELCKHLRDEEKIVTDFETFKRHCTDTDLVSADQDEPVHSLTFQTTHAVMAEQVRKKNNVTYKSPAQSHMLFREFWRIAARPQQNTGYTLIAEDPVTAGELVWKEIHGVIKGACPSRIQNKITEKSLRAVLQEDYIDSDENKNFKEYKARKQSLNRDKSSEYSDQQIKYIYKIFRQYQQWLEARHYKDDNDLARDILRSRCHLRDLYAVYIDECQDLTEMQLLALFFMTRGCRFRKMASDRCQIVQPTFFDQGIMLSRAKLIDEMNGNKSDTGELVVKSNWRSSPTVIAMQNYTISQLDKVERLKSEEKEPVEAGIQEYNAGTRPVWIKGTTQNMEILLDIWRKRNAGKLNLIYGEDRGTDPWDILADGKSVADSKGMEYPAVLAWNILNDKIHGTRGGMKKSDLVEALRYFYVAVTRSVKYLFILEEDDMDTYLPDFLDQACHNTSPLVNYCEDLTGFYGDSTITWKQEIERIIDDNISREDIINVAEGYIMNEKYEDAIRIYEANQDIPQWQDKVTYCRGKIHESQEEYGQALDLYLTIGDMEQEIETLAEYANDEKMELAVQLYLMDMADDAYGQVLTAWRRSHPEQADDASAYVDDIIRTYPAILEKLERYKMEMVFSIQDMTEHMVQDANNWRMT